MTNCDNCENTNQYYDMVAGAFALGVIIGALGVCAVLYVISMVI